MGTKIKLYKECTCKMIWNTSRQGRAIVYDKLFSCFLLALAYIIYCRTPCLFYIFFISILFCLYCCCIFSLPYFMQFLFCALHSFFLFCFIIIVVVMSLTTPALGCCRIESKPNPHRGLSAALSRKQKRIEWSLWKNISEDSCSSATGERVIVNVLFNIH